MSASTPDPRTLSSYHARLPYGERVSPDPLVGAPFFPFEGDGLTVVALDEPIVPEPPRGGEPGGEPCFRCADPDANVIWRDDQWEIRAGFESPGLPMVAGLNSRDHVTLRTMPDDLTATLGSVIRRAALAVERVDGVARTHINRWGDGSAHFHMWFLARPLGMMQLRGAVGGGLGRHAPPASRGRAGGQHPYRRGGDGRRRRRALRCRRGVTVPAIAGW